MKKRWLIGLLALCLSCSSAVAAVADGAKLDPMKGVSLTANDAVSTTTVLNFGSFTWYLLKNDTDHLYVLSQYNIAGAKYGLHKSDNGEEDLGMRFCTNSNNRDYSGSLLQAKLNDIFTSPTLADFSDAERSAVVKRTLDSTADSTPPADQALWPLSLAEFNGITYNASDSENLRKLTSHWWLRTPGEEPRFVYYVDGGGTALAEHTEAAGDYYYDLGYFGIRPGAYLAKNRIVMITDAEGGKGASSTGSWSAISAASNHYKLTLLDDSRNSFQAEITSGDGVTKAYTLSYQGASVGKNAYLSLMIADNAGKITHYQRLKALSGAENASGSIAFSLPKGVTPLTDGSTLYAFSEEYNGDNLTDYASPLVALTLPSSMTYHITEGADSVWRRGSKTGLRMVCDGIMDSLTSLEVDGVPCTDEQFDKASGSTIVTLHPAYLSTLTAGSHTLRFNYPDGYGETQFTITVAAPASNVPQTGDRNHPTLLAILAVLSAVMLGGLLTDQRRKAGNRV